MRLFQRLLFDSEEVGVAPAQHPPMVGRSRNELNPSPRHLEPNQGPRIHSLPMVTTKNDTLCYRFCLGTLRKKTKTANVMGTAAYTLRC
jgi:hypothetical protein